MFEREHIVTPMDGVEDSRERIERLTAPARKADIISRHGEDGYLEILQDAQDQLARALEREKQ